jgi:colanic acid/amylovoran biosynthesis protein
MAIVLTGVTGLRNRGVEALVRSSLQGFARYLPHESTIVLTTDPLYDGMALQGAASVAGDWPAYFQSGRIERYLRQMKAAVRSGSNSLRALETIKNATAVVASGGDVFSSDYGTLRRHAGQIEIAQAFGIPTMFLAHSIGPFKTEAERRMMRTLLQRATVVSVRESRTRQYLVQDLRLPSERILLTADVAFLLAPSPPARVAGLKRSLGIGGSSYVVLAPSEGITSFSSTKDRDAHDRAWIRTIEHILTSSIYDVLIVPHVQDVRPIGDDRRIATRLVEATGFNPRVRVAWGELSANDFKGLIQDACFLIGERMHACIAGLSTAVPTIAIGYSVKAQGIMEDLLGPNVAAEGLLLSVARFVASNGLQSEVEGVMKNCEDIRRRLVEANRTATRLADANFVLMRDALGGRVRAAA